MAHTRPKTAVKGKSLSPRWKFSFYRGTVHGLLMGIIISSLNLRELSFVEAFLSLKAISIDALCIGIAIPLFAFFLYEQRLKSEAMIQ